MIAAFLHAPHETLGSIAEAVKSEKSTLQEFHLYRDSRFPDVQTVSRVISMGGPMNVDETDRYPFLAQEVEFLKQAFERQIPVLGICLGSQLIAKALGARVHAGVRREVGWHPLHLAAAAQHDPLFMHLPEMPEVLHWHGDTFDLPPGAEFLASSEKCRNQAFRAHHNVYALQFHLEVTEAMVKDWLKDEEGEIYAEGAGEKASAILAQTPAAIKKITTPAQKLFRSFLTL